MASEQNDRKELYKQYATEQLALESTGMEMKLINVKEYEKTINLVYVDRNKFCDMLKRITEKQITPYLPNFAKNVQTSNTLWNDLVANGKQGQYISARNAAKIKLSLFLYVNEVVNSQQYNEVKNEFTRVKYEREQKLTLPTDELVESRFGEQKLFVEACEFLNECAPREFCSAFKKIHIPVKDFDSKKYVEDLEFLTKDGKFYLKTHFHSQHSRILNAIKEVCKFTFFHCNQETKDLLGVANYNSMSNVLFEKIKAKKKEEYEKRVKDKNAESEKRKGPLSWTPSESQPKRAKSVPADRKDSEPSASSNARIVQEQDGDDEMGSEP